MRRLRPEFYSDSADRVSYLLDAKMLEYCLESITSRNEMHDFEIFCRKLCERMICPNLKPSTNVINLSCSPAQGKPPEAASRHGRRAMTRPLPLNQAV